MTTINLINAAFNAAVVVLLIAQAQQHERDDAGAGRHHA